MNSLISRLLLLCGVCLIVSCSVSDIRPGAISSLDVPVVDKRDGEKYLTAALDELGGLDAWQALSTARVTLRDYWPNAMTRLVAMPWEKSGILTTLDFRLREDNGRLTFEEGDAAGSGWGVQQWVSYTFNPDGDIAWEDSKNIRFWVPTLQYFVHMPFRLYEAEYVLDGGTKTINGRQYRQIFCTWGGTELSKIYDQYVIYIRSDSHKIDMIEYTVRDIMKSVTGVVHYSDFETKMGLTVPRTQLINSSVESTDKTLHRMEIEKIEYNVEFDDGYLIPDPQRTQDKH